MLIPARAAEALERGRDQLRAAAQRSSEAIEVYLDAFDRLGKMSTEQVNDRLGGVPWPGARPTAELTERGAVLPFDRSWASAQEARAWAMQRLHRVPTLAVDGSQIAPSKEFGVSVSIVQVAWFENWHDPDRPYVKDVRDEIVLPEDVEEGETFVPVEARYSRERFRLEMSVAAERLQALPPDRNPLALVDGTFVLSFAGRMKEKARETYFNALFDLLAASRRSGVPVVGYVDLSFASDLVTMLRQAFDLPREQIFDAQLLAHRMDWFDRSAVFECARADVLPLYREFDADRAPELYFVYLKMGEDRLPARLDIPGWVVEAGKVDSLVDTIRAEAVVGAGYPYALETADAAAVLGSEDRMAFYRMFHDFARASGLQADVPGKSVSKGHRR